MAQQKKSIQFFYFVGFLVFAIAFGYFDWAGFTSWYAYEEFGEPPGTSTYWRFVLLTLGGGIGFCAAVVFSLRALRQLRQ